MDGANLAGNTGDNELELSPAPSSEDASGSTEVGSKVSDAGSSTEGTSTSGDGTPAKMGGSGKPFVEPVLQSAEEYYRAQGIITEGQPGAEDSTSGDDTSPKMGGSGRPFVEPVLQSAEEYYRARGVITEGQPGAEDTPDLQEKASGDKGSQAAAFVEPQLQSAEEYYRQLGLISGEAPSAQGKAAGSEAEAAVGDGEQESGTAEEPETEEEPSWNLAASGKGTAQPSDDTEGALEDAMLPDALQEGQTAERDPLEPLEIVLDDDAGELPAGWYNDEPRFAGAPEEPFWNAAGQARVVVKRQTGKKGNGGVNEARHLLRTRQNR